jgi:hypothetical protein
MEYSLIAQPVSEINALDHSRRPLVAFDKGNSLEHIFDVAMSPIFAFNS